MLSELLNLFLHIDEKLVEISQAYGIWIYLILFIIIFAETGFVVTPFLPGDSLLFAAGALAALDSLNILSLLIILSIAAILGDTFNYAVGYHIGPRVFKKETGTIFNRNHLIKTQNFYEKHGGKTIILARFIPIIRTFAPFVAGIGKMRYFRFLSYNIFGAILWVFFFVLAGFFFGNIPFVKENFEFVIIAIILISILPLVIKAIKRRENDEQKAVEYLP